MKIIDSHSHFFSHVFFESLVNQLKTPHDSKKVLADVSKKANIEIPTSDIKAHTQKWLKEMDKNHVDHLVTFASLPQEMEAVAQALEYAQGRLSGYTLVNPLAPESPQLIKKAARHKFRGILLFPVMHQFSMSDKKIWPILEIAREYNLIVVVHFGLLQVKLRDLIGLPRPFDLRFGNPLDLQITSNHFNFLKFIIPHFGCGFFRETLMLGSQCENIFVDTSSSNSWIDTQPENLTLTSVFEKTLKVFGPQRVLFGTDSSVFPRGWRQDLFSIQKQILNEIGIEENHQEVIFSGNISRLLNP